MEKWAGWGGLWLGWGLSGGAKLAGLGWAGWAGLGLGLGLELGLGLGLGLGGWAGCGTGAGAGARLWGGVLRLEPHFLKLGFCDWGLI